MPLLRNTPKFRQTVELDQVIFTLSMSFNTAMNTWIMSILDAEEKAILMGIPMQHGIPLTLQEQNVEGLPPGSFLLIDESGQQRPLTLDSPTNIKLVYVSG